MADGRLWDDATAAVLAGWLVLAEPMVEALTGGADTVPAAVLDDLATGLASRMLQVANASARLTAREAAEQGVDGAGGEPDRDRLERLAATFAELIATGYAATAVEAALTSPMVEASRLRAVAGVVRKALEALGTALTGLVPAHVGAAMAAAEHEGRRAVAEAHPPLYLVADEHDDLHACGPCRDVAGRRYDSLDAALEDYPTVGYRLCNGGIRCRGKLRAIWREPTISAPSTLAEAAVTHAGAMIALVPSVEDAARLAVDGGESAGELHCTIAYLGKADQLDTAARQQLIAATTAAVQGMPVVDADVFGLASFGQGGEEPCNVLNVGGVMLDAAHHFLTEFIPFEAPDQHTPWHAHVTLEYTGDLGRLGRYVDRLGPVRFDRVRLAIGGDVVDIPLLDAEPDVEDDGYAAWLAGEGLVEADAHVGDGQLKRYWLGKGLSRWAASPHPWTALFNHLRKYIKNTTLLKKTVSRWYIDHFGRTPNRRVAESATITLVETGTLIATHPDDISDDEPLSDDELALVAALDELDGAALAEVFDPTQARYPKGHPLGGKFRPMVDRIKQSIEDHRAGKHGDKHPLDGYSREQLRRVAKARGIELKRGEDRDSIARKLLDDHGQTTPEPKPVKNAPAPASPQIPAKAEGKPNQFAKPFHRNLNGIEDLAKAVEDGLPPKQRKPLTGGVSAETELVTLKDGTKVVHKSGGNPDAEQAASMVAQAIGAPAPRVYRDSAGSIYMDYIDDAAVPDIVRASHTGTPQEWREQFDSYPSSPSGRLVGLLDLMTVNGDRNTGNWMVKDDGSIVAIDHGHAYLVGVGLDGQRIRPFLLRNAFTAQLVDDGGKRLVPNDFDPSELAAMRTRLEARRPDFEHIGRGRWLDYSLAVLDAVAGKARGSSQPMGVAA